MKRTLRKEIYKDTFQYIWVPICLSVFQACLQGFLSVKYANIFGNFADAVFALNFAEGLRDIYSFLVALLITVLLIPALAFVNDVVLVKNALSHDRKVLGRFLNKSCDAVNKIQAGDMLNRLNEDPNELRIELIFIFSSALMIPPTAVYLIFNVVSISLEYFGIVLAVSLIQFLVPVLVKKAEKKYHKEEKEYNAVVRSYETDIADRAYLVNLFGMREAIIHCLDQLYIAFFKNTERKSIRLHAFSENVQSFADTFCLMIILLVGAYFVARQKITPGAVAAMVGYYSVLNTIINNLAYTIRKVPILDNLAGRLEYFYADKEVIEGISVQEFDLLQGEKVMVIRDGKSVFEPLSFTVKRGDKTIICGENGSGKSTLMKIMLGLLREYQGKIKINGTEISKINIDSYRSLVAYAPQDPYLFRGTVFENIKLAKRDAEDAEIKRLLQEYGILNIADREIGSGGYELSGGEKQKLSIIRAMIKDSQIVFIDEPENNLDARAMRKMENWVQSSNKTVVYVSHSPKLIACATQRVDL